MGGILGGIGLYLVCVVGTVLGLFMLLPIICGIGVLIEELVECLRQRSGKEDEK